MPKPASPRLLFALSALALAAAAACQTTPSDPPKPQPNDPGQPPPKPPTPPPPPPPDDAGPQVPIGDAPPAPPADAGPLDTPVGDGGGDASPGANLIEMPLADAPMLLKDIGLFPNFPDLTQVNPKAFHFDPRFPLYSNGLEKTRYLVLPAGQKIDSAQRDRWQFPVGTLLFKTFSDKDATGKLRPIETRLMRRKTATGLRRDQWEFLVYEWSEDGKTATLLKNRNAKARTVTVNGKQITHMIPSNTNCLECHIANFTPVIGFDELRLNGVLPNQTKTQLAQVIEKQMLSSPPAPPFADIVEPDAKLKVIKQYMVANCGHCHNGGMTEEDVTRVYDLRADKFVMNTVSVRTEGRTKAGCRVVGGRPEQSILLEAMTRVMEDPELKLMPPVGVQVPDQDAITKLREWILTLPARPCPPN